MERRVFQDLSFTRITGPSTMLQLIALIGLAGYGLYVATYLPALLIGGPPVPLLLISFALQVVCFCAPPSRNHLSL